MRFAPSHARKALLAAVALTVALPAGAAADTLVYKSTRDNDIWAAKPNGSHKRRLTSGGHWAWPSEARTGTVAVLGPGKAMSDLATDAVDVYVISSRDRLVRRIRTAADFGTLDCPTFEPTHARISPDGRYVAYDVFFCDHETTAWSRTSSSSVPSAKQVISDFIRPTWRNGSTLLVSNLGVTGDTLATYRLGAHQVTWWFNDPNAAGPGSPGWATGFDPVASPDGRKVAVAENDAANYVDGNPRHVALRVYPTGAAPKQRCSITLSSRDWDSVSPTFAPNGRELAYANGGNVYVVSVGNAGCGRPHRVISGALEPFWSAGPLPR